MALHPTSELVMCAWLSSITGIDPAMVATQAPDPESWPVGSDGVSRFITTRTVGGSPPRSTAPLAGPVMEIKFWATKLLSNKPPWFAANQLAEIVRVEVYGRQLGEFGRVLTIRPEYNKASVINTTIHIEPRRIYSDARNFAVYQMDLGIVWREVGLTVP